MNELARVLRESVVPDPTAEQRAWRLAHAAYVRRATTTSRRARHGAVAVAAAALVLTLALTPAGGSVVRLVRQVASTHSAPAPALRATIALRMLPGGGRLLALRNGSAYVLGGSMSPQRLGRAHEATFSAFGHYVAAAQGHALTVYALDGRRVWSLEEPNRIRALRWSPDGLRLAYRAGSQLRIVDGNGENPRTLGHSTGRAVAWRPGPEPVLTYLRLPRLVVMRDVSTDTDIVRLRPPTGTTLLTWSTDGRRLLALGPRQLRVFSRQGASMAWRRAATNVAFVSAAFAPGTHRLALLSRHSDRDVISFAGRKVATGPHLTRPVWSPDGRWLVTRSGPRWIFVAANAAQHDGTHPSTTVDAQGTVGGWCCTHGP